MTLTVRSASTTTATTKGAALTHAEMDANWLHLAQSGNVEFLQSGSGAQAEEVQTALRRLPHSAQYSTAGNFNTAQAALTGTFGMRYLRLGTGDGTGITLPSQGDAPFACYVSGAEFNGQVDPVLTWAYNPSRAITSEPLLTMNMEGHYYDGANHYMELNLDYTSSDGLTGKRILALDIRRDTHAATLGWNVATARIEASTNGSEFVFTTETGNLTRSVADGNVQTAATAVTGLLLKNASGGSGNVSSALAFDVGGGQAGAKIYTESNGSSGGILHFATDTSGGVMTDRWSINATGRLSCIVSGTAEGAISADGDAFYVLNVNAGSIRFQTNDGTAEQLRIATLAGTVNYFNLHGRGTGALPVFGVNGSDTDVGIAYLTKGTGAHQFFTAGGWASDVVNAATEQLRITNTASANRYITATGSNGGNPAISVSGGELSVGTNAWTFGVANSVSPTSPNRTLTVTIGATTYYIHAKTTND